jgi:phosphoesterase RecJ-like protein
LAEVLNQALKLNTGRIVAMFRETRPGVTKVSLRSKGQLDVNRLARRHGGGGHRNASGIVLEVEVENAVALLLPDLERLALDA